MSIGVTRMWTKMSDMHQEVDVLIFLIHAQKGKFWMFTF